MTEIPDPPLAYRLLTGEPDRAFCERVSEAVTGGYDLYGPPILTTTSEGLVAAQAVVLVDGGST